MRSTFSRSKLMIFLSRRSNGVRPKVDSRYPGTRKTFLSSAVFAYMSLPAGVLVPIWSVLNSLAPFVLKLTAATGSRNP